LLLIKMFSDVAVKSYSTLLNSLSV